MTMQIKQLLLLFLFTISSFSLFSQSSSSFDELKIRIGYSKYPGPDYNIGGVYESYNNYRLDASYELWKPIEIGGHLGYSKTILSASIPDHHFEKTGTIFFGGNLNLQIIPIFIKAPDFPIDLYLLGRYGGYYLPADDLSYPKKGFYGEIKHGLGLDITVFKGFGFYAEYSFNKVEMGKGVYRCGISYQI